MKLTLTPFGQTNVNDQIESFKKKDQIETKEDWKTNLTLFDKYHDQKSNLTLKL